MEIERYRMRLANGSVITRIHYADGTTQDIVISNKLAASCEN